MSSKKFAKYFRLELVPSRRFSTIIILIHTLALSLVLLIELDTWLTVSLILFIVSSAIFTVRQHALIKNRSSIVLLSGEGPYWKLINLAGDVENTELIDKFLSSYLIILYFKDAKARQKSVILYANMLLPETWRQLKVDLRFSR